MIESPNSESHSRRKWEWQRIFIAAVFLFTLVASNWIYSIGSIGPDSSSKRVTGDEVSQIDTEMDLSDKIAWVGGWPYKYFLRVENDGVAPLWVWSSFRFFLNILIWSIAAGVISVYFLWTRRQRDAESIAQRPRMGQVGLADLLILMLLLALMFGYWRLWIERVRQENDVLAAIEKQGGNCGMNIVVPSPIASILPTYYASIFSRITSVSLNSPNDEILGRVLALPELRRLRIGGGIYDLKKLEQLRTLPYLRELRVSGRELDGQAVAAMGACKQLVSLNLMRTNISTEGLQALSEMSRLRALNLVHTAVDCSKIGKARWLDTVQELVLPHPSASKPINPELGDGVCEKTVLQGLPQLQFVYCQEFDELENGNCMVLEISDCPRLTDIGLDAFQRFDLVLRNVPQLKRVHALHAQWSSRMRANESIGLDPWLRKIEVVGSTQLARLNLFGQGLEEIRVEPNSMQYLGISSEFRSPKFTSSIANPTQISEEKYLNDLPEKSRQRWIDELGRNNGPAHVDLSWLSLQGLDLSSLRNNPGIKVLDLSWTNVAARQLIKLEGMVSLEKIILYGIDLDGTDISRVLAKLPNLRVMAVKSKKIQALNLESLKNVESLFLETEPLDLTKLRLVSIPSLRDKLEFRAQLTSCEIADIPSVQGLSFFRQIPKGARISGMRDLHFFSAGGVGLTDEIVSEVLRCKTLRTLTLAFATQVSPSVLAQIAELPELEYLSVPGCKIDDAFVRSLAKCKKLTGLILDNTSITNDAFKGLGLESMDHFSVNHTSVTEDVVLKVLTNQRIVKLGLAGMKLNAATVDKIARCKQLEEVDFSGTHLDSMCWKALTDFVVQRPLLALFRDAKVDAPSIREMLTERNGLVVDLTGAEDPNLNNGIAVLVDNLLTANRFGATDRIIDTWQPQEDRTWQNPTSIPSRYFANTTPNSNSKSEEMKTNKAAERPRIQGEISLFPFSPRWKSQ